MRSAERIQTDQPYVTEEALDEATVLEYLEADLSNDEDRRRIRGIGNGVAMSALVWIFVIGALVWIFVIGAVVISM